MEAAAAVDSMAAAAAVAVVLFSTRAIPSSLGKTTVFMLGKVVLVRVGTPAMEAVEKTLSLIRLLQSVEVGGWTGMPRTLKQLLVALEEAEVTAAQRQIAQRLLPLELGLSGRATMAE